MAAETPQELESVDVVAEEHAPGSAVPACVDELVNGREISEESNIFISEHAEGQSLINGDPKAVSNLLGGSENEEGAAVDTDPSLGSSVVQSMEMPPSTSTLSEAVESFPEELDREGSSGVALSQVASTENGSGWTDSVKLTPEEEAVAWMSVDGSLVSAPPPGPEQTSISSGRRLYYMVKIPRFVDNKLKNRIRLAELQVEEMNRNREFYRAAVQLKRATKGELLDKLKPLREREKACRDIIQSKRVEMEPYQLALNKFRNAFGMVREKGQDLCSSEEQLNERIAHLQHRIEHESIPLKEEKQLLREIKQLEATRSQVCANVVLQAELVESVGPKEEIQERCKLLGSELDALRKEHRQIRAELEGIEKEVDAVNASIEDLGGQLEKSVISQKEAYESFKELRKQDNAQNAEFYNYRRGIQSAKEFAMRKNMDELEKLCLAQVEHVLALWNNDREFREAYLKNNARSTLRRLETLDGRSLGPDEEPPLLISELDTSADALLKSREIIPAVGPQAIGTGGGRTKVSRVHNEDLKLLGKVAKMTTQESLTEVNVMTKSKNLEEKDAGALHPSNGFSSAGKPKSASRPESFEDEAKEEVEAVELKQKRRQEEIAKAREAAERKKRQAERSQSKALFRAQKDAERREKEKEKRARKKSLVNAAVEPSVNPVDADSQAESRDIAAAPAEVLTMNGRIETQEFSRTVHLSLKKTVGKKTKPPRPAAKVPLFKKKAGHLPVWFWAMLVVVAMLFFVLLGSFWVKF